MMIHPETYTENGTGSGLLKGVIIDQHFAQRGRIGRLLLAIAENPNMIGIGIDEDTGVIVMPNATLKVIGSNGVTILMVRIAL